MEKRNSPWLLAACILLGAYLIIRLIDLTEIFTRFPLDNINDYSSYFGILHLLHKYGYYGLAPEWYNGFIVLKYYSPGWWFLAYPFYLITKNVQTSSYATVIFMLGLGFLVFRYLGKALKLTTLESTLFFLLFFANPINIADFYRLGRFPAMFAWLAFAAVAALIYTYKGKALDTKFILLFILSFSASILSHPAGTMLTALLILSLFLIKPWKEKIVLFLGSILSLSLTSFWWFGFITGLSKSTVQNFTMHSFILKKEWLGNLAILLLVSLAFLTFLYLKLKETKSRKELLFYTPQIMIMLLLATQLMKYIPGLNQIYANFFIVYYLFLAAVLYFQLDFSKFKIKKEFLEKGFFLLAILFIASSHGVTAYFPNQDSQLQKNALDAINHLQNKFAILGSLSKETYSKPIYTYATVYKGLSTISGWSTHELTPEHLEYTNKIGEAYKNLECDKLKVLLSESTVQDILLYSTNCNKIAKCNFQKKYSNADFCVYGI